MQDIFNKYYHNIKDLYNSDRESTEHTFRTAFENFLNSYCTSKIDRSLNIRHEPKQQGDMGRPDFKTSNDQQLTIGLIETKKIKTDLDNALNTKQLENYKNISDNLILTDYLRFILIKKGEILSDVLFIEFDWITNKKKRIEQDRIKELDQLLSLFFSSEPDTIYKTDDLAVKLSEKALSLKKYCYNEMLREKEESNLLHGLYDAFRDTLLPSLSPEYFSDIYAQTLTYGLFLASLNCDEPKSQLTKATAHSLLPNSFILIKELFHSLDDFPVEIVWSIDEIITILKVTDFSAIKKEFNEYRKKDNDFNDPFIYFYEDFLKYYDKEQREIRGVYYTPESVVSFIVRSIENILKRTFNLNDGFINEKVTLLDFATGTGTFLLNCFDRAIDEALRITDKESVNKLINEHLINNFYGFELLVAPYVVAHLKISEYLKERGFSLDTDKRLSIYLTNTLSNKEPKPFAFMPHLSKEGKKANEIKNKDILVILGNPPYSVSSSNKIGFIAEEKMGKYKDSIKTERNIQPISDDYIKFIRFAHWKMESVDKGIVGVITNNSFVDGLIHRKMRYELLKEFDEIYILNLHGNSRIGEKCPDGSKDENIFDIMQGVAISIFVKKNKNSKKLADVFYSDLYGIRKAKKDFLSNNDISRLFTKKKANNTPCWEKLEPQEEYYFFSPKDFSSKKDYEKGFRIDKIFKLYSSGIKTHNDDNLISFNKFKDNNKKYCYRPFDIRNIDYDLKKVARHRISVMQHILNDNISIGVVRQVNRDPWNHVFVFDVLADICSISIKTRESAFIMPLYLYNGNNHNQDKISNMILEPSLPYLRDDELERMPNFTKEFESFIKNRYKTKFTPEEIFGYIYAVLHSPTYRTKYIEFLKIDFPRIPFAKDENLFRRLSETGSELMEHHLMKKTYSNNIVRFDGSGNDYHIKKIEYENGRVSINDKRYFEVIPKETWEFHIGSYQVLEKWLKERKRHRIELSSGDIIHFLKIANVLDHTIKTMSFIDDMTKDWI